MEQFEQNNILLVEDSALDAELAMSGLRACNRADDIIWVRDGQQAIDYLFREGPYAEREDIPPRLILLDLKMPKVNGIETLKIIKADQRTRRIPVVVMTSSREDLDLEKTYDLGVNSYVVKPLDLAMLTALTREAAHYWIEVNQQTPV